MAQPIMCVLLLRRFQPLETIEISLLTNHRSTCVEMLSAAEHEPCGVINKISKRLLLVVEDSNLVHFEYPSIHL